MNKQFPYYIEDWIVWLGSKKDNLGNEIDFSYYRKPPVKLANYDVSFVNRSTEAILRGTGFTERQLHTATKIVTKYRRQILNKINTDPGYLAETELPPHNLDVREVDRSFAVHKRQQDYYEVRFPYNVAMVESMHRLSAHSTGGYTWDKQNRYWHIRATEPNLALLRDFVRNHKSHSWSIDTETRNDFASVDSARSNIYAHVPYLEITESGTLEVFNANEHLAAALETFDFKQDIANVVFRADNYGLHIGPRLTNYVKTKYSNIYDTLLLSQADIFQLSKNLDCQFPLSSLEPFMKVIRAKHWLFVSVSNKNEPSSMMKKAMSIEVPGQKIFCNNQGYKKYDFLRQLDELDASKTVIFSDNSMLMSRLKSQLVKMLPLRAIYLYGHNTGLDD